MLGPQDGPDLDAANETAEIAVEGAVRVDVPSRVFTDAVADVKGLRNEGLVRLGIVGADPQTSAFDEVSLSSAEVEALKACPPGRCAVELPEVTSPTWVRGWIVAVPIIPVRSTYWLLNDIGR